MYFLECDDEIDVATEFIVVNMQYQVGNSDLHLASVKKNAVRHGNGALVLNVVSRWNAA